MDYGQRQSSVNRKSIRRQAGGVHRRPGNGKAARAKKRIAKRKGHAQVRTNGRKELIPLSTIAEPFGSHCSIVERHTQQDHHRGRPINADPSSILQSTSKILRLENASSRHLSHLESLPTEILEVIFFYNLILSIGNACLNLPRASLTIGRKLASDYVRKELFLQLCSDLRPVNSFKSKIVKAKYKHELSQLQSWILRQQWFTLDFFRRCIPDFQVSILLSELSRHGFHWLRHDGPRVNANLEPTIRRFILDCIKERASLSNSTDMQYVEQQWIETAPSGKRITLGLYLMTGWVILKAHGIKSPPENSSGFKSTSVNGCWRMLSLYFATQIPNRLLHGPWTSPKIEFLEILVRGGASVDWVHTTGGETAEQGFNEAIEENNARALRALCSPNNFNFPRGVGVTPKQTHLLAAINKGCHEDVVEALLNAPRSECNLQDVQVMQELLTMRKRGWMERANWLHHRVMADRQRRSVQTGN